MNASEDEQLLADCVEEYLHRRALGEAVEPEDWRERLGDLYEEFMEILLASSAIDEAIDPEVVEEKFPRPWNHFTLLKVLARGSMGTIYKAVDRKLGRDVALKVLRADLLGDPDLVERFRREARTCARTRHDHVVQIYDYGVIDGQPYYSMPLIEGDNLLGLVKTGCAPAPEALARGLAGIADALANLHELGIIHRDVKPSNIMVDESGRMILADFGIAKSEAMQGLTRTEQMVGTPFYMSPEQVLGGRGEVDGRTDVYGLGVTLYEVLAGRPPFKSIEHAALLRMIMSEQPEPLSKLAPDAPEELATVAMTAMEKEKDDRYGSAAEMRDDLRAFAEGRPVEGRPVSTLRRRWRRNRRNLLLAASLFLFALIAWKLVPEPGGRIRVISNCATTAAVDGREIGAVPTETSVRAGEHEVAIYWHGHFIDSDRVSVDPRETETIRFMRDGDDEKYLQAVAKALGVDLPRHERRKARSGPGEPPAARVVFPRGKVRLTDLMRGVVEFNDDYLDVDGTVEVRQEGRVLLSVRPVGEDFHESIEFTENVRKQLKPGVEATFGYYPKGDDDPEKRVFASFTVVEDAELAGKLAELDRRLTGLPGLLQRHLKAQVLFDADFYTGAILAGAEITDREAGSARAWMLQIAALERLGVRNGAYRTDLIQGFRKTDVEKQARVSRERK